MVKRAFELWERLDGSLYVETGVLWMHRGSDAYVRSSQPILNDVGFEVEPLPIAEAARRYPQIDFDGLASVWFERKGGALSARRACVAVGDAFVQAGGTYRTAAVKPLAIEGRLSALQLEDGSRIEADAFVFACGPWLGRMFPDVVGDRIQPTRQEVYYFGTPCGSERYLPGRLPIWMDFGKRIVSGFPTFTAADSSSPTTRAARRSTPPPPIASPPRQAWPVRAACSPSVSPSSPTRRFSPRKSASTRTVPTET
jgi:glycine/D-amino acid oxidase-like deaminating enzyme